MPKIYIATIEYENTRDSWDKQNHFLGLFLSKKDAEEKARTTLLHHFKESTKGLDVSLLSYEELKKLAYYNDELLEDYSDDLSQFGNVKVTGSIRVDWTATVRILDTKLPKQTYKKMTKNGRSMYYCVELVEKKKRVSKALYEQKTKKK